MSDWISLIAVLVAPLSVLAGAWLNAYLTRKQKATETDRVARGEALAALGRMTNLVRDARPDVVLDNALHEYHSPQEAIAGLYEQWLKLREPFALLSLTHPNAEVRALASSLPDEVQFLLGFVRQLVDGAVARDKTLAHAEACYNRCAGTTVRLGRLLSPFQDGNST